VLRNNTTLYYVHSKTLFTVCSQTLLYLWWILRLFFTVRPRICPRSVSRLLNHPSSSLLFKSGVFVRTCSMTLVTVCSKSLVTARIKALVMLYWLRSFPMLLLRFARYGPFQCSENGPFQGSGYTFLVTVLPKALVTIRSTTCNIVLHKC
jgi:hypothetical protein